MTLTDTRSTAFDTARRAMIVSQLRTSGVNEPWVLEAMDSVAREDFVPADLRDVAYIDRALPLGNGRMLAAPLVHARLIADARPTKADKALLVSDSDGYLAALLRPLVGSLDVIAPDALASVTGPADITLVVIDGAVEVLPDVLTAQIAEGGRVSCGLMVRGVSRIATGTKTNDIVSLQQLAEMGIPALPEFAAPKRWSF